MAWPNLHIELACTFRSRLQGLLFRPPLACNQGLCLVPCAAIHTWAMAYAIDVVFLNARGQVLKRFDAVVPSRWAVCRGAFYAVELRAGYCAQYADYAWRIKAALREALAASRRWDDWHRIR